MSWEPDQDKSCDKAEINEAVGKLLESFNYDNIAPQPTKGGGCTPRSRVKRPMNAFMVFAQAMRRRLSEQRPSLHNAELSKSLGLMWRNLNSEDKLPFKKQADKLRIEHKKEYPDYKYQPRRRKPPVASAAKLKREPSPVRDHFDFAGMPEINSPVLLPDGPPDGAEFDQYLKPPVITEYHEMQPRYTVHNHVHHTPSSLYATIAPHFNPSCSEWQPYPGHS